MGPDVSLKPILQVPDAFLTKYKAMNVADFAFELPAELIAQAPAPERGASRLLVLRKGDGVEHTRVSRLADYLHDGDLLVVEVQRWLRPEIGGGLVTQELQVGRVDLLQRTPHS